MGDQDDEERELRMKLLQSSGSQDEDAKSRKKKKENRGLEKLYGKAGTGNKQKGPPREQKPKEQQAKPVDGEGVGEEERAVDDETSMLPGLTGLPLTEDELLFAVPVVAPYSTVLQYKYKVKLTPGTGKRQGMQDCLGHVPGRQGNRPEGERPAQICQRPGLGKESSWQGETVCSPSAESEVQKVNARRVI